MIPRRHGKDGQYEATVPTVRDRVAQQAAKIVLEPVSEPDFLPCSYGFRPGRSALQAMERLRTGFIAGYCFAVEFGIRSFFGEISHDRQRAMKRLRDKVRASTGRNRCGDDIREVIADLNPLLRGWGNYFRPGNAAGKFIQVDGCVAWRLKRLLVKKHGRNLPAGQADQWTREWLHGMGLHKLSGTIRYPKAA
jgi:hypothetical protein